MENPTNTPVRLTQFSHGAGCGCKISPKLLRQILSGHLAKPDERLLVGNNDRDDAAVYEMPSGECVISTIDFFMPIVDDPFDFGRVAATNSISDVYAMGGKPFMALSVLGWPIKTLAPEIASQVLAGARQVCEEAGVSLAGGHSIDSPEPIFGLSVNGHVKKSNIKKNSGAMAGDLLFLTKPIGIGMLTTAEKRSLLKAEDRGLAVKWMTKLNTLGVELGTFDSVTAMTDVTGFGLLGHLASMCEASQVSAELQFSKIPLIADLAYYFEKRTIPDGTNRNWDSYGANISGYNDYQRAILGDPQTSGGLLIAVRPEHQKQVSDLLAEKCGSQFAKPIGEIQPLSANYRVNIIS